MFFWDQWAPYKSLICQSICHSVGGGGHLFDRRPLRMTFCLLCLSQKTKGQKDWDWLGLIAVVSPKKFLDLVSRTQSFKMWVLKMDNFRIEGKPKLFLSPRIGLDPSGFELFFGTIFWRMSSFYILFRDKTVAENVSSGPLRWETVVDYLSRRLKVCPASRLSL